MHQHSTPQSAQDEPLTLAVHTLPDVVNPEFVDVPPSGRAKLLAILFACLLPVLLYFIVIVARPLEHSTFGTAITPLRAPRQANSRLTPRQIHRGFSISGDFSSFRSL